MRPKTSEQAITAAPPRAPARYAANIAPPGARHHVRSERAPMNTASRPLTVSIPHRLGRAEAQRRIQSGLGNVRTNYASLLAIDEEVWSGNRLTFRVRAMGQSAAGTIDVEEDHVVMEITLPGFLGVLAEKLIPAIRKEGTLLLEK